MVEKRHGRHQNILDLFNWMVHRTVRQSSYVLRSVRFTKAEFQDWIKSDPGYDRVHREWELGGYERRLAPTIDRIDNDKDYSLDNIQVLPMWLNAKKGTGTL